ncbi:hypothetical protein GCM10008090_00340 [Arenicella chitinivorans]|uniref:asparagine synthase (glutamine-hydrolyzing) n=1 Tax=Arenicella chitinivorans TaxID=1329800 RepID=A0A918RG63_9GAMM|nr:asparagine synthase-related protein [Arenicella chitinivorans]GGZ96085.1 hypothetical protein GCM10008090_00340 [Arenicella chitinivorans]
MALSTSLDCANNDLDDQTLLLHAFQKWGAETHHHVEGAYIAIIVDADAIFLFRGVYDSPGLYYRNDRDGLTISTDATQLLRTATSAVSINSEAVRHYLAYSIPAMDAGFFHSLYAVPAGQALKLSNKQIHCLPQFDPMANSVPVPRETKSVARQWQQAYLDATRDASALTNTVGLFLSGGLDSGALAVAAHQQQIPLETINLSLPDFPDEDEWAYAEHLSKELGLPIHRVDVRSHCFDGLLNMPVNLLAPGINPYQAMINQGYELAAEQELKQIWFGTGGDELFAPKRNLLRDLWQHRQMGAFVSTLCSRRARQIPHVHKTWLNAILHRQPRAMRYPDYILGNKTGNLTSPYTSSPAIPIESQYHRAFLFQSSHLNAQENERPHTAPRGLQRVHPCIHPSLIEQGLLTPAYQAHSPIYDKAILRTALADLAPAAMRRRGRVGVLRRYYDDGWNHNLDTIREVLSDPAASWPRFVARHTVENALSASQSDYSMLLLNCLSLELWLNALRADRVNFRWD